jgi:hypothetical protein
MFLDKRFVDSVLKPEPPPGQTKPPFPGATARIDHNDLTALLFFQGYVER